MNITSQKVSIVLPTFNRQKYLRTAIESCLAQTYQNIELILVDDCSTDRTPDIISSYKDARVRVIRNQTNQRLPRSLNIGFQAATGDYLTWTSDDNEFFPEAIEKMLKTLKREPPVEFVYADYWLLDETTGKKKVMRVLDTLNLRVQNEVGACFLYTRHVYDVLGDYNPNYPMVEDYDYWIRIWKRFATRRCEGPLYVYRSHAQTLTSVKYFDQELFIEILKYRSGYSSLSKLGWTAVYYFENVKRSPKKPEEKMERITQLLINIRGLSLSFFLLFRFLVVYFSILKGLRAVIKKEKKYA